MLIDVEELAAYVDIPVDSVDLVRLSAVSRVAESLIRNYAKHLPDDVDSWPETASVVALRVVGRAFGRTIPEGVSNESLSAGVFSRSWGFSDDSAASSIYLNKQDKEMLAGTGPKGGAYGINLLPPERVRDGSAYGFGDEWLWRGKTY